MFFLSYILLLPVAGPYKGMKWILEEIHEEVQREQFDEGRIKGQLTELQLRMEGGEIAPEEYGRLEEELMEHLAAVRQYKREMEEEGYYWDEEEGKLISIER